MLKKLLLMVILFLCVSCDQQPEDFCYSDQKKHKIRSESPTTLKGRGFL